MSFRPLPGLTIAALIALGILISLGSWQLQRLAWKQDLISRMQARVGAEPAALATAVRRRAEGRDIAFLPVRLEGRFAHDKELHYFTVEDGKMGRRIFTPFKTVENLYVLVDRGFVPDARRPKAKRAAGLTGQTVSLLGQVRPGGKKGFFVPDNQPDKNDWYWRDHGAMAAAAGLDGQNALVPFFVESSRAANGGWPNGRATRPKLINKHLEYALTWFALALVMLVIYFILHSRAGRLSFGGQSRP